MEFLEQLNGVNIHFIIQMRTLVENAKLGQ